jgi:hypothetical protein
VYYNRLEQRPAILTRAVIKDDTLFKLWERKVPGMNLHHWGDAFEGKIYQPSRSFVDLPSELSKSIGYDYGKCKGSASSSDEITVFDEKTGAFIRKIDLLPIFANLQGDARSILKDISICPDPLHFNAVQIVRNEKQARYFPGGKVGDMLLSFRAINTILLLDKDTLNVKWFVSGGFYKQHDPNITDHGTILVFDNKGSDPMNGRSRIVEVSIASRKVVGMYEASGDGMFDSDVRGKILLAGGQIIVQEEFPYNHAHNASMFTLSCPGPYVSMDCTKQLIFEGASAKFMYANAGLIKSY